MLAGIDMIMRLISSSETATKSKGIGLLDSVAAGGWLWIYDCKLLSNDNCFTACAVFYPIVVK